MSNAANPSPISEREDSKGKAQSFEKTSPRFSSKTCSGRSGHTRNSVNDGILACVRPSVCYVGRDRDVSFKPSLTTDSRSRNKGLKHSVSFYSVEVREYKRTLSDNPAVSDGVPIGLDWDYNVMLPLGSMTFDAYEESRPPRRDHLEFQIPAHARARMMQEEWGHSYSEVLKAYQEASRHRQNRSTTLALGELGDGPTIMVETVPERKEHQTRGTQSLDQGTPFSP